MTIQSHAQDRGDVTASITPNTAGRVVRLVFVTNRDMGGAVALSSKRILSTLALANIWCARVAER